MEEEDEDLYDSPPLLALTGVRTELKLKCRALEQQISQALNFVSDRVSVMEFDNGTAHFVVYPDAKETASVAAEQAVQKMTKLIKGGVTWLEPEATCAVLEEEDMEEEIFISEADALNLWREMKDIIRTADLAAILDPDGKLIVPTHDSSTSVPEGFVSPTHAQLQRDPSLLEFDNVRRVDVSQLGSISWKEPFIVTGVGAPLDEKTLALPHLLECYGETEVRTGNRNTLVENGFNNSKPMGLRAAMQRSDPECSRIVFSPINELPDAFRQELASLMGVFSLCEHDGQKLCRKFTMCLANEGFGVGFHSHSAAMFLLAEGRKKWYMGPPSTKEDTPTHPGFYSTKSSHRCIQHPGEVLYVPDQWYHEIFNLEYTAGIQALS